MSGKRAMTTDRRNKMRKLGAGSSVSGRLPPADRYDDEVTKEHLRQIDRKVDQDAIWDDGAVVSSVFDRWER